MRLLAFFKREVVLTVAALCALATMVLVPPDAAYLGYIDLRVLCLLLCLMAVYGLTELTVRLSRRLWLPRDLQVGAVVLLHSPVHLEQLLHRTTEEMLRDKGCRFVAFVDTGLEAPERELAAHLAATGEYSALVSPEDLPEVLRQQSR